MSKTPKFEIARIYDHEVVVAAENNVDAAAAGTKGAGHDSAAVRVLVDRLWPRGVSREKAAIDLWPKDATPTSELRKTWHADPLGQEPSHFEAFKASYRAELAEEPARTALKELAEAVADAPHVLLLTAAKTPDVSHAPVIAEALEQALATPNS